MSDASIISAIRRLESKIDRIEGKLDVLLMELAAEEEEQEEQQLRTLDGDYAGRPREEHTPL